MSLQVDSFWSFRSPYSFLAVSRVIALELQLERVRRTDYSGRRQRSRIQLVVQRQHVPDVLNVPGFVLRSRFRLADTQFRGEAKRTDKYLAVYEMETNDLNGVLKGFRARGGTADIVTTYTLDAKNVANFSVRSRKK